MLSPALRGFSLNMDNFIKFDEDTNLDFKESGDSLLITKAQEIPDWWIQQLKEERFQSKNAPTGNFHRAASIPKDLHEAWLLQGYDCTREPIRKTLAKLKSEGLDYFITTDKQL